jgi:hypothetical protein
MQLDESVTQDRSGFGIAALQDSEDWAYRSRFNYKEAIAFQRAKRKQALNDAIDTAFDFSKVNIAKALAAFDHFEANGKVAQ